MLRVAAEICVWGAQAASLLVLAARQNNLECSLCEIVVGKLPTTNRLAACAPQQELRAATLNVLRGFSSRDWFGPHRQECT